MSVSIYRKKQIEDLKKRAIILYKQGLPLREVGNALTPKRSHEWVRKVLKEKGLSTE